MELSSSKLIVLAVMNLVFINGIAFATSSTPGHQNPIPNIAVLDQDGVSRHFYTDLVEDKIVAINFIFTSCQMTCPMLGFKFGQLRKQLGDDAGTRLHLISITTDAAYDTPQRLKSWSEKFNSGVGWTQLTGEKQQIDQLLKSLKAFSVDKLDHSTLVLLINDKTQQHKWIDGNSDPRLILQALSKW